MSQQSHDLQAIETWAASLLANLSSTKRRQIAHQIAKELSKSQQDRIKAQLQPDGTPFTPRKQRKNLKGKQGRIKRQKAAMFNKIRLAKYLKAEATANEASVGFNGRVAEIARVHQYGLTDKVSEKQSAEVKYPVRELLGLIGNDIENLKIQVLKLSIKDH